MAKNLFLLLLLGVLLLLLLLLLSFFIFQVKASFIASHDQVLFSPHSHFHSCFITKDDNNNNNHHHFFFNKQKHNPTTSSSSSSCHFPTSFIHSSNLKLSSLFTLPVTMNIGSPTNVRHVAHVTFDRFNGFLGLPVEFEPEVPRRPPSASATVFGVSTDSMQLSYDSRGNSVPTILLLMQSRLYSQGGLQAEGIFRINADNSQEEYVREQLNLGVVPETVDVHSLAALIKAWFRELPTGVLDSLSQDQVLKCQTEEDCTELVRHLPHTEASLLDWAINLMADVVEYEHLNKMNARNVAMVFAPNMTQMADPITALMYAVQVMNFLKTLILRTLRERKDSVVEPSPRLYLEPFRSCLELPDENLDHTLLESSQQDTAEQNEEEVQKNSASEEIFLECCPESPKNKSEANNLECSSENQVSNESLYCDYPPKENMGKSNKSGQSSSSNARKGSKKSKGQQTVIHENVEKKGTKNLSSSDSKSEQIKPWR